MVPFVGLHRGLERHSYHHSTSFLHHNIYETEDSWIWIGWTTFEGNFFSFGKSIPQQRKLNPGESYLYANTFFLDQQGIMHHREVYTAIDALGDLGGFIQITLIIFGSIFLPISRYSYYLKAARFMFFARTKDGKLFVKGDKNSRQFEKLAKYMPCSDEDSLGHDGHGNIQKCSKVEQELKKHHLIRLSIVDTIKLFFVDFIPSCCWQKKQKF